MRLSIAVLAHGLSCPSHPETEWMSSASSDVGPTVASVISSYFGQKFREGSLGPPGSSLVKLAVVTEGVVHVEKVDRTVVEDDGNFDLMHALFSSLSAAAITLGQVRQALVETDRLSAFRLSGSERLSASFCKIEAERILMLHSYVASCTKRSPAGSKSFRMMRLKQAITQGDGGARGDTAELDATAQGETREPERHCILDYPVQGSDASMSDDGASMHSAPANSEAGSDPPCIDIQMLDAMASGSPLAVTDSGDEGAASNSYPVDMRRLNQALESAGVPNPQLHQKIVKRPAMKRPAGNAGIAQPPAPDAADPTCSVLLRNKHERGKTFWQLVYKHGKSERALVQYSAGRLQLEDAGLESIARAGLERANACLREGFSFEQMKDAVTKLRDDQVASA